MQCPICSETVGDLDLECAACTEQLAPWRTLMSSAGRLRERGLAQASQRDFAAASLSFLQAALTNPFDTLSLIDAGRALLHMNKIDDGLRLLSYAQTRDPKGDAPSVIAAVQALIAENARHKEKRRQEEAAAETEGEAEAETEAEPDAESEPEAEEVDAAPADMELAQGNGQPHRRLLELPVLRRRGGGWWSRKPTVDPLWQRMLEMEAESNAEWPTAAAWLEIAVGDPIAEPLAPLAYGRGLAAWQQGRLVEARQWFERIVGGETAVLNPAVYYVAASLDDASRAHSAIDRLKQDGYATEELENILTLLEERIGEQLDADWQELCDQLRTILTTEK